MNSFFHGTDSKGDVFAEIVAQHHGIKQTAFDKIVKVIEHSDAFVQNALYIFQRSGIEVANSRQY